MKEEGDLAVVRVYPKAQVNGELARQVAAAVAQHQWKFEDLHTEEGRLDEVFRSITMPDTAKEVA